MTRFAENIASKEDVLERAVSNLKKDHDIELSDTEMSELYDITYGYIKKKIKEESIGTLYLSGLGTAYFDISYCGKMRGQKKRTKNIKEYEKWCELYNKIEEHYQNNQTKKNRMKGYKFYPILKTLYKKSVTKGFQIEDIEEIQNKIE